MCHFKTSCCFFFKCCLVLSRIPLSCDICHHFIFPQKQWWKRQLVPSFRRQQKKSGLDGSAGAGGRTSSPTLVSSRGFLGILQLQRGVIMMVQKVYIYDGDDDYDDDDDDEHEDENENDDDVEEKDGDDYCMSTRLRMVILVATIMIFNFSTLLTE